jgi:hypothetical protein
LQATAYDLIQIPLDYVPHISLQMFLHSLDDGAPPSTAAAWASVQLVTRIVRIVLSMTKWNLYVDSSGPKAERLRSQPVSK